MYISVGGGFCFCRTSQLHSFALCYNIRSRPIGLVCKRRSGIAAPQIARESFVACNTGNRGVVDDDLCNHLLFDVKPHRGYETSHVAYPSVSLPIDGTTIYAVTWCHLKCIAKLDALTGFHLNEPHM
ncbi:hypothetical protein TNCV_2578811 [Trichonephila clavipes]|nr:hypothetical protein TNCV_2578811 [Trichonephila clavipes]